MYKMAPSNRPRNAQPKESQKGAGLCSAVPLALLSHPRFDVAILVSLLCHLPYLVSFPKNRVQVIQCAIVGGKQKKQKTTF